MDDSLEEALIIAVVAKDEHSCRVLAPQATVNAANSKGWTPLHLAARYSSVSCADILIRYDVHAQDCIGCTPLWYTSTQDMFDFLKQHTY